MKTNKRILNGGAALVVALLFMGQIGGPLSGPRLAFADNPYEEGVSRRELTPAERESLMLYANNSKALLERAVRNAKGKPLEEANDIYLSAIKRVVAESYKEKRRSELLMRIALNQGLELTLGVPSSDGNGIQKAGVLKNVKNSDLITVVLEQSIGLALQFYQDDRTAIEKGTLIELPYIALAQKHLSLGREWLAGVNEWSMQLSLSQALLEQWQTTVLQEDHMTQTRVAETILDVEDALKKIQVQGYTTQQKVRFLRGVIKQVLTTVQIPNNPPNVPVIPGVPVGTSPSSALGAFARIPHGTFQMGSPESEPGRDNDERLHTVTISRDFEMQATTVTQAQWVAVMGSNPSHFKEKENCPSEHTDSPVSMCPNHPVESISWNDTQEFIRNLNEKQRDGYSYRLPTEAEWEYAARAGTQTSYSFAGGEGLLLDYAWFSGNSGSQTHKVATKKPNAWGLYDMHGNVWQWVMDVYGDYPSGSVSDPLGASGGGSLRVLRGGSWGLNAQSLRSANRNLNSPGYHGSFIGLRLARTRQ